MFISRALCLGIWILGRVIRLRDSNLGFRDEGLGL